MTAAESHDNRDPRDILRELKFKVLGKAARSPSALSYTERTDQPYSLFPVEPYADPLTRFARQFDDEVKAFLKTVNEKESRRHDDERRAHARTHLEQVNRDYDPLSPDPRVQRHPNRLIDAALAFVRKARLWLVRPSLLRQQAINAEFVRFCNAVMEVIDASIYHQRRYNDHLISVGERFLKVIVTMQETRDRLKHQWDIQHFHFDERVRSTLDGILVDLANLRREIIRNGQTLESRNRERLALLHASLKAQQDRIAAMGHGSPNTRGQSESDFSDTGRSAARGTVDADDHEQSYFTDEFRGSFEDIRERQRRYVPHFHQCRRVLDIGSGRGEFLELLREAGIHAEGLERNSTMVALCRERDLLVHEGDAISFLESTAEETYDGIFAAQIIEHIPARERSAFITRCQKALRPGGRLVIETVNPLSFFALTRNFMLDPTHREPVHPESLLFQMRLSGFEACELQFIHPVAEEQQLSPFSHAGKDAEKLTDSLNAMVTKLNEMLFGFQDYAIMARKSGSDDATVRLA